MTTSAPLMSARRIERDEAATLAHAEYDRFLDLLRGLHEDDWVLPTDCTTWKVREIVAHVVGWAETLTMRDLIRLSRAGKAAARQLGGPLIDGMNSVLIRQRSECSPAELLSRLERAAPAAVTARASVPAPLRLMPMSTPEGRINLGYLNDHIFTRDLWIHRVDISRAAGREMALTADHDGRIVADVVTDWEARHRRPFVLVLEGAAGGAYGRGEGEEHRLDAVEFCRIVSGRAVGTGLLGTRVLF